VNKRDEELAQQYEVKAAELGVSLAQYLSMVRDEDIPYADIAYQYQAGKPLLSSPEEIANISTKQRRLHQWYLHASKQGLQWIDLAIKDEHFFHGDAQIHVEMEELFQIFNQREIDVAIISCYCL
jgi:hypothetical protein